MTDLTPLNLAVEQEALLEQARTNKARKAAKTIYGGAGHTLRQVMMALAAGGELAEHDSPPEATLQVLRGRIRLTGQGRAWELGEGDFIPIPSERHSVEALEESVFILTVRL